MKETYHVPRAPDIVGSEHLVNSSDSEELLTVLGSCTPETSTARAAKPRKIIELRVIETSCLKADDDHHVGQTSRPFQIGWEEPELKVETK